MQDQRSNQLIEGLKAYKDVAAAMMVSVFGPVGLLALDFAPPFLGVSLTVISLGVMPVFVLIVNQKTDPKKPLAYAFATFLLCLCLLLTYQWFLSWTTVSAPDNFKGRMQIGFGMMRFSLTEDALEHIETERETNHFVETPDDLMMNYGVWGGETSVTKIWTASSVFLASSLLLVLYLLSLFTWSFGTVCVAKALSSSED